MTYVLVILLVYNANMHPTSVEFNSKKSCEEALFNVAKAKVGANNSFCARKGYATEDRE